MNDIRPIHQKSLAINHYALFPSCISPTKQKLMRLLAILTAFSLLMISSLAAQSGKVGYPGKDQGKLTLLVQDFEKQPVKKAKVLLEGVNNHQTFIGVTDKGGVWEVLVPNGETYRITIEDSVNYDVVEIPSKDYVFTRHLVYFQGAVGGKTQIPANPMFNMKPPADGMAAIEMSFTGLDQRPLVGEQVWLKGESSGQEYTATTNAQGQIQMKVPLGDNYKMRVKYNANFDKFSFPRHGGSANAKVSYTFAGSKAIEEAREQRRINDSLYNAYRLLSMEDEKKLRDGEMHKTVFRPIPVTPIPTTRIRKTDTDYGYHLTMTHPSAMSSPLWLEGRIFAGGGFETSELHCFDGETGDHIWSVSLGEGGPSTLSGGDDVVVLTTESCTVYALQASTGKLLWSKWLAPYVLSAPSVADGKVFIGYEDNNGGYWVSQTESPTHSMACMDLKTGNILWQQWLKGEPMSAAVAQDGKLFCSTFAGFTYSLDANTGKILQEKELWATSAPTIVGDRMYLSQRDPTHVEFHECIAQFDANTFDLLQHALFRPAPYLNPKEQRKSQYWAQSANASLSNGFSEEMEVGKTKLTPELLVGVKSVSAIQGFQGSRPLVLNGKIFASMGTNLVCYDTKTMAQLWDKQVLTDVMHEGGFMVSQPILCGNYIAVACMDGSIRIFDVNGNEKKRYTTQEKFRMPPIVMHGTLFATSTRGKMVAVNTGKPELTGWQCWGGNLARTNTPHP